MTDPSGIKPIAGNPAAQTGGKGQVVQIVSLPEGLQNNAHAIRLQGEVVQQNQDGTVRVRTPEGDIDINVRGRQPQPGQKIEVDIPPGSPPKQAAIRPAPAQAPQPQQPAPQPPHATPPVQGQPAPPAAGGTAQPLPPATGQPQTAPIDESLRPLPDTYQPSTGAATKPAPAAPLPPLAPGQTVKLVPLPQSIMPMPEEMPPTTIPRAAAQVSLIAQKSEGTLIATLLQAVKSVLPQSPMSPMSGQPTAVTKIPQPAGTQPLQPLPANVAQMPLVLPAKIISLVLPSGQILTAPQANTTIPSTPVGPPSIPASMTTGTSSTTPPVAAPITVTVTEMTPQQQPVISIPMNDKGAVQNFVLQSPPASVPIGTQVTLQPQPIQIPTPAVATATPAPVLPQPVLPGAPMPGIQIAPPASMLPPAWRGLLPPLMPAAVWPAMDELFQTFYQATPQAAQILGRTIPSPANGANFGPAIMLFAAALKSGELQAWMGDKKLEMLQKLGKNSLLTRLSGETSSLSSNADAPAAEWKSFPVPMLWQNEISKVMFHVRKEPSEHEQEEGDGATRFVMDLSLTRMGDVQIDGLVRGKQLDLIVRTQMPISYSMQDAMRVAYAKALDGTDIFGDIGFQSDVKQWTNVLKRGDSLASV